MYCIFDYMYVVALKVVFVMCVEEYAHNMM